MWAMCLMASKKLDEVYAIESPLRFSACLWKVTKRRASPTNGALFLRNFKASFEFQGWATPSLDELKYQYGRGFS